MQKRAFHLLGRAEESLAGAGQLCARRAPVEEFRAEGCLERRDAAAHRGVIEPQPLGGGDELPGPGDGEENPDVVPVHDVEALAHFRTAVARTPPLLCAKS